MQFISKKTSIGSNVFLGQAIILGASKIGDHSFIDNNVIVGYPKKHNLLKVFDSNLENFLVLDTISNGSIIGQNAIIRAGTVIYEDVKIGEKLETGHNVLIREDTIIGNNVKIGTGSVIDGKTRIGNNVNIQSMVYIPLLTIIEDNVFIGPNAVILNDKYPPSKRLVGVHIEKNVVIGGGAVILPGVRIGKSAVIGAGAVVTRDVAPRRIVVGSPAREMGDRNLFDRKKKMYEEEK